MLVILYIVSAFIVCFVSPAAISGDRCVCMAFGDTHYMTGGSQLINFHGPCRYNFLSSQHGSETKCDFSVDIVNDRHDTRNSYSTSRMVYISVGGKNVTFGPGSRMQVNSFDVYPPYNDGTFKISFVGGYLELFAMACGLRVSWDGHHMLIVTVPGTLRGQTDGICGNCNGEPNGSDLSLHQRPSENKGNKEKCNSVEDNVCKNPTTSPRCDVIKDTSGPFGDCISSKTINTDEYYKACNYDACVNARSVESTCMSIEAFAARCRIEGYPSVWRSIAACPLSCPKNTAYNPKLSKCEPRCFDRYPENCLRDERDACECADGYILSGTTCEPLSFCGCVDNDGRYYKLGTDRQIEPCGEVYTCMKDSNDHPSFIPKLPKKECGANSKCQELDGTRLCVCTAGFQLYRGSCMTENQVKARKTALAEKLKKLAQKPAATTPAIVKVYEHDESHEHDIHEEGLTVHGDPEADHNHKQCPQSNMFANDESCVCCVDGDDYLKTFDDQIIKAKGLCTYSLSSLGNETENCHFEVTMKTTLLQENGVTFNIIRLIQVHLLGYIIRLNSNSGITFDSLNEGTSVGKMSDFIVSKVGENFYKLSSPKCGITVSSNGHQVYVVSPKRYAKQTRGLCGDCDGYKNDLVTRHGEDINNVRDMEAAQKMFLQSYIVLNADNSNLCDDDYRSLLDCTHAIQQKLYDKYCEYIKKKDGAFNHCLDFVSKYENDFPRKEFANCKVSACRGLHNERPVAAEDVDILEGTVCLYMEELEKKCKQVNSVVSEEWRQDTNCWQNVTELGFHHEHEDSNVHHH